MGDRFPLNHTGNGSWMRPSSFQVRNGYICALPILAGNGPCQSPKAHFQLKVAFLRSQSEGRASLHELITSLERGESQHASLKNLISISRRCEKERNLVCAKHLYTHVCRMSTEIREQLGNYIVPMFVECGCLRHAQDSFDFLAYPNEFSWAALVRGYFDEGNLQQVLHLFDEMQKEGVTHNRHTIVTPLKACARLNRTGKGRDVHNEIYKQGLESDLSIGNTLIGMYVKFGFMDEATEVFEKLLNRDVISWNALMTGYKEHGPIEEVFDCLGKMTVHAVAPDNVSLLCCLQACCLSKCLNQAHETYSAVVKHGFAGELILANAAIDMYTKCGAMIEARQILEQQPIRDVISWTALISGYVDNGCGKEALRCLEEMKKDGVSPNSATLVCSLKACGSTGSLEKGRQIQADIPEELYRKDPALGNSLVDMYAKCGSLLEAQEVFDQLPSRTLIAWNALIAGFVEQGLGNDALDNLEQMQLEGMSPSASTLNCSLKACGLVRSSIRSQEVHIDMVKKGFEQTDLISNTLVDVYAKCGLLEDACHGFEKQKIKDVISWTALISGYADGGLDCEAVDCLKKMQLAGVLPSAVTMACSLKACPGIGAVDVGQELHAEAVKRGLLNGECSEMSSMRPHGDDAAEADCLLLGNALVDMYGKFGNILDAAGVFYAMPVHDLVSWNALISSYSRQGHSKVVFELFEEMRRDGVHPDDITFLSIINVCSHAGLVFKARTYFESMTKEYKVTPTFEHYNCVIDLLARAGQIVEALEMLERMPFQPTIFAWCSMLGACRKSKNVKVGRHAFDSVMKLDDQNTAAHVLMFNIYMDACMWEEAKKIDALLQALKGAGKSWMELGGIVYTCSEEDVDTDQYKDLHAKL